MDNIEGCLAIERRQVATAMLASLINASTLVLTITGYTAETTYFDVIIWGTSSA